MKKKNISKVIMLLAFFLSVLFLMMSCNDVNINNLLNINKQEKNGLSHTEQDKIDFTDENKEDRNKEDKIDVTSVLLIKQDVDVEKLLKILDATLINTLEFDQKKYIVVKGMNMIIEDVQKLSEVYYAEPDYERHIFTAPDDTLYSLQYAPQITGLESAWEAGYTGAGVVVAVIDTGVDTSHKDFGGESTFVEGYNFTAGKSYGTNDHNDINGHGTHVAGIIGARRNNGMGIAGVAPDSIIMPIKANVGGGFSSANIAAAIKFAVDNGADVINMSLGGQYSSTLEMDAVAYAIRNNVTVIVAAGNDSLYYKNYPASITGVIAVASTNEKDEVSSYSTRNNSISVGGPGENILSLKIGSLSFYYDQSVGVGNGYYVTFSGTSMASPYVAGVAALIKQKFPDATPAQVKKILESTALDIDPPGFDSASGHGRVQADQALARESLPDVSWVELEFELRRGYSIESSSTLFPANPIIIFDSNNDLVGNLITGSNGKASIYLPVGTYTYATSYYGLKYEGSTTLVNDKVSLSKTFIVTEIVNYYRIETFYYSEPDLKSLIIYRYEPDLVDEGEKNPEYDFSNYESFAVTLTSDFIFEAKSGDRFMFWLSNFSNSFPIAYDIVLGKDILGPKIEGVLGNNIPDVTNGTTFPIEKNEMELSRVYRGILELNDYDFFFFTIP